VTIDQHRIGYLFSIREDTAKCAGIVMATAATFAKSVHVTETHPSQRRTTPERKRNKETQKAEKK
jgi:copper homeostasis protein CutC